MANFNKVILAGYLTRDPELRYTPKGTAVSKFGIAMNRHWTTEAGEEREEVTFVDVDCFGKTAETVSKYFRKGKPMLVEGRLKLDQWDDKQTGQKRSKLGVVMESFSFLDSLKEGQGQPCAESPAARSAAPASAPARPGGPGDGDDVPF